MTAEIRAWVAGVIAASIRDLALDHGCLVARCPYCQTCIAVKYTRSMAREVAREAGW